MALSLGLGIGITRAKGGFSLAAFMASQSDGFWYDFGQTDRLFQEDIGPTAADDPNEVIGLALSSRLWNGRTFAQELAASPELIANGTFDANLSGWATTSATASWSAGRASVTSTAAGGRLEQERTVTPNRLYRVTANYDLPGSQAVRLRVLRGAAGGFATLGSVDSSATGAVTQTLYFFATGADIFVQAVAVNSGVTFNVDNVSLKEVSRYPATQATSTFKPTFQTTGAKFDGTDDNLLTGYTAGAGANFIVARVTVPATLPSTRLIAGSQTVSAARFFIGVDATGKLLCAIGSGMAAADPDLRGRTVVVGMTSDGVSAARLFVDGVQYDRTVFEPPSTSVPIRIGAGNHNNAVSNPWEGTIHNILGGREYLDLARFLQIASQL